jgi:Leucine-rich repeat (LRR) protein
MFIVKKDEPSSFPGFQISTMAMRNNGGRRAASEVFVDQASEADQPELPPLPVSSEQLSIPDLSEDETLVMLAPAAFDRMRIAQRTHRLDLSGFLLCFVPTPVQRCSVVMLNLAGNSIRNFGTDSVLSKVTMLEELDLSFNLLSDALTEKAPSLENLCNLQLPASITNLSLRENELVEVPPPWFLEQMPLLSGLDLRSNKIAGLDNLSTTTSLIELMVSFNLIEVIPAGVFVRSSESLKSLELSHNSIHTLPPAVFTETPRLELLDVSYNRLPFLGFADAPLHNLTSLDISHNAISVLGAEFGLLTKLTTFRARDNNIANVSFSFSELQALKVLDLSYNRLRSVPDDLVKNSIYIYIYIFFRVVFL